MDSLKQFMRRNVYRWVGASVSAFSILSFVPSNLLFGEIPFPMQEYMNIKNKMK